MIELRGVEKRWGGPLRGVAALAGIDLDVGPGERLLVVGPNGAGKSTLFGVLAGLVRPDGGRARVAGLSPAAHARARGVGWLPDGAPFPPRLPVREVLLRLAILDGLSGRVLRSRVDGALERTGLADRRAERTGALSRGLRQRLGIAALLLRPRSLLLLDEPFAGLDPLWRAELRAILEDLGRSDPARTILLASHELGDAARLADRVLVVAAGRARGRLPARGSAEELERAVLAALAEPTARATPAAAGGEEAA